MLTLETLESLARCRRERLLHEASCIRLAAASHRSRGGVRAALSRAARELGSMLFVLGDALAERAARG